MASRYARPAHAYFGDMLAKSRTIARESAQENIGGAQTISIPSLTVSATSGTSYAPGQLGATTLSASISAGLTTSITVASAAAISVGSVLLIGGTSAGEIQWVTGTAGTSVAVSPGIVNAHNSGAAVTVLAVIESECYTAQDPTGVDLGTSVVASMSSQMQFPSSTVTGWMWVVAIRTQFQYAGLANVKANEVPFGTYGEIVGPQWQPIAQTTNGSAGSIYNMQSASTIITLEWPTIVYDYTVATATGSSWTSANLSGGPGTGQALEMMIGDDDEPAELAYGTFSSSTFSITNTTGQANHAIGASAVNATSSGQSNWTFIPYYATSIGSGTASVTFAANTLTIDPR